MEKNFLEIIRTRRSYRSYKPEQITDEQLNAVLEAGTYAPTGMNLQSPVMVVIQDKDTIRLLEKENAVREAQKFAAEAAAKAAEAEAKQ